MLTEKECRTALEILKEKANGETVDAVVCFKELIDEHFDNPPLDCTFNKSLDFKDYRDLLEMKHRGYFKGISDTDMKLGEILENCEVVEG